MTIFNLLTMVHSVIIPTVPTLHITNTLAVSIDRATLCQYSILKPYGQANHSYRMFSRAGLLERRGHGYRGHDSERLPFLRLLSSVYRLCSKVGKRIQLHCRIKRSQSFRSSLVNTNSCATFTVLLSKLKWCTSTIFFRDVIVLG